MDDTLFFDNLNIELMFHVLDAFIYSRLVP